MLETTCTVLTYLFTNFLIPFTSAVIGGLFLIYGSKLDHKHQLKAEKDNSQLRLINILEGISTEIKCLWRRYYISIGKDFESSKDDKIFDVYYKASLNYFVIYESSAGLVGSIENKKIRTSIVELYIEMKSFLDGIFIHNDLLNKLHNHENLFIQTNNIIFEKDAGKARDTLMNYEKKLKEHHFELNTQIHETIELIEAHIASLTDKK